jgi:hypothetical protein
MSATHGQEIAERDNQIGHLKSALASKESKDSMACME